MTLCQSVCLSVCRWSVCFFGFFCHFTAPAHQHATRAAVYTALFSFFGPFFTPDGGLLLFFFPSFSLLPSFSLFVFSFFRFFLFQPSSCPLDRLAHPCQPPSLLLAFFSAPLFIFDSLKASLLHDSGIDSCCWLFFLFCGVVAHVRHVSRLCCRCCRCSSTWVMRPVKIGNPYFLRRFVPFM